MYSFYSCAIYVAAKQYETHLGLQALHPTFLSDCDQIWGSLTDFHKVPDIKDVQRQLR
jgi:hypothetical protein